MNSISKVVLMAEGKRNKLSLEQRIEMWHRWKAGESSPRETLGFQTPADKTAS